MCKFCNVIRKTNVLANHSHPYDDPRCTLKELNEEARDEIHSKLSELGIGKGMVSRNCSLFGSENMPKCPWFEQA